MEKLRLRQLRDLARAFRIPLDLDAPKDQIMPALMAAANAGTFRRKPDLPYYWHRAHRTGDEKDPFEHPYFADPDAPAQLAPQKAAAVSPESGVSSLTPVPASLGTAAVTDAEDARVSYAGAMTDEDKALIQKYAHLTYAALRAGVKKINPEVKLFGVTRLDCCRILEEGGHESPSP